MTEENQNQQMSDSTSESAQPGFWQQVYRHRLALISLAVAIISLAYNTWRNESTEAHRNIREAAFNILLEIGELQEITGYRHYFYSRADQQDLPAHEDGDWVRGWGKVLLIRDLSNLMPAEVNQQAISLNNSWQQHAARLELGPGNPQGSAAQEAIMQQIDATRNAVLDALKMLE